MCSGQADAWRRIPAADQPGPHGQHGHRAPVCWGSPEMRPGGLEKTLSSSGSKSHVSPPLDVMSHDLRAAAACRGHGPSRQGATTSHPCLRRCRARAVARSSVLPGVQTPRGRLALPHLGVSRWTPAHPHTRTGSPGRAQDVHIPHTRSVAGRAAERGGQCEADTAHAKPSPQLAVCHQQ